MLRAADSALSSMDWPILKRSSSNRSTRSQRGLDSTLVATVLGSGHLALILDPGSIAQRAGISLAADADANIAAEDLAIVETKAVEYLLVDLSGHRAAIALDEVIRIEQLPVSCIEYIGHRPVLNLEGQVLPIEDSGGVLAAAQAGASATLVVVVCSQRDRHVGIAVSHVLDVAAGADLFEAGNHQRTNGATLLKDLITGIVDSGNVMSYQPTQSTINSWAKFPEAVQ